MKILGVNIVYDAEQTMSVRRGREGTVSPGKLHKIRVYEVTDEYDYFKKYHVASGWLGVVRVHVWKVVDCWFRRLGTLSIAVIRCVGKHLVRYLVRNNAMFIKKAVALGAEKNSRPRSFRRFFDIP